MRIPLPVPLGSSLMSGFLSGANVARSQDQIADQQQQEQNQKAYQNAVLANQKAGLALKAPLIAAQESSLNQMTKAKLQTLADAHAVAAIKNAYLHHLLSSALGQTTSEPSTGSPTSSNTLSSPSNALSSPSPAPLMSSAPIALPPGSTTLIPSVSNTNAPSVSSNLGTNPAPSNSWDALGAALGMKQPKASANAITPVQKAQLGVNQAVATAQGTAPTKINNAVATKQLQTAEAAIPAIMQSINSLKTMKNIVNNPQEGKGFWSGGIFYPGSNLMIHVASDPDRGAFKAAGANVVAQLTKAFSQRGGAYAARMAASFKPSLNNTAGANSGMVTNLLGHLQSELRQATRTIQAYHGNLDQYGDLSPYLDPSLPVNTYGITPSTTVQVRAPDGTIHTMTYAEAQKLGAK